MTEGEPIIYGRVEPPRKIYRTCTFEVLGSRKDEFLSRVVEAMEKRGLRKVPPIKPFGHHLGVKDALRLWDFSMFDELARQQMVGTDVLLAYDKEGTHKRVGLRAEEQGKNLRFGYFYGEKVDLKSAKGIKFILELILYMVLVFVWPLFVGIILLGKPFYEAYGLVTLVLIVIILFFLPLIPFLYIVHRRETRPIREIDQRILEIAESMGGKQITPFKKTTVKLED